VCVWVAVAHALRRVGQRRQVDAVTVGPAIPRVGDHSEALQYTHTHREAKL
jgi:hypothetical protein